jgi:hypothetical protein
MKNLVLGSLIALTASQAAGCIIESGGDDAYVTANWTFRDEATGTTTGCPSGFDTVALYNQEVDGSGASIPGVAPIIDLFDCVRSSGTSAPLPAALFKSWIEVTDHNNTSKWGESTMAYVDVTVSDKSFNAQLLNDGGYFYFAWNLYGATTDADLSCAQAGASGGVEAIATDVTTSTNSATDMYDCEDGAAYTAGYRAATYNISVDALNAAAQAIGTAPTITNKAIGTRNAVTNLGTIEIPITGL